MATSRAQALRLVLEVCAKAKAMCVAGSMQVVIKRFMPSFLADNGIQSQTLIGRQTQSFGLT